ncbi:outer membrane protein assembly factor BamD [Bacillus solitudinis]|uniref:hypothetical protein n=1 Tax=Bacillus solitudinis TaxID=2014074 RepID=UPI000C241CBB|nr:hypothetical protein [Bacillus solitudinis]
MKSISLALALFSISLLVGCSNNRDENESIKELAWGFIEQKGWDATTKGDWKGAIVTDSIADERYELFDNRYEGKQVISVSFEDKKNVEVSTPVILVDSDTNMPGE